MENYVQGKVVVVTGSGFGFGRLICQKVAKMGGHPVVSDIDGTRVDETIRLIKEEGYDAIGMVCDVRDLDACKKLVELAIDTYGKLDVFVNNAGIMPIAFWSDHKEAVSAWNRGIDINLKGTMNGIIAAYDPMMAQGYGHVVCISSMAGNVAVAGEGIYSATKIAVRHLARSLKVEAHGKIKVTIVNPTGVPDTGLLSTVINPNAFACYGTEGPAYLKLCDEIANGTADPAYGDRESIKYLDLSPDDLTDSIMYCINQPWGVNISEITVTTANDMFSGY